MQLTNWMENSAEYFNNFPLNHIILPGTHDSGAYELDFKIPIGNKKLKFANYISKFLPCVGNIIKAWTITQKYSIYDQLNNGIRLFDFRVSYSENENEYYITHTFTCVKLNIVLCDIAQFLNEQKKEVLILQFTADWEHRSDMTTQRNNEVIDKIHLILNTFLYPRTHDDRFPTYKEMVDENKRVIVYYERSNKGQYTYIWPSSYIYSPWDNTDKVEQKIEMLDDDFEKMKDDSRVLNFISFTLTPQVSTVKKDVFNRIFKPCCYQSKSVHFLAEEIQKKYNQVIIDNEPKVHYLSGIMTDFPTKTFIENVIKLNEDYDQYI